MNNDEIFIWYSKATDITGKKLQEALEIRGGYTLPEDVADTTKLIIGWGTKTKKDITLPEGVRAFNHPNDIRVNRHKFDSLSKIKEGLGEDKVPTTFTAQQVTDAVEQNLLDDDACPVSLPLIGRRNYHQGGKGFWACPTAVQLEEALSADKPAQYFQKMELIKNEYRLHVFDGKVIHAVKKVKRTAAEFEQAFIEDELARQANLAQKNNDPFDEDMARRILTRQAKNATAGGPNMILRSNRLGWKFSIVKQYPKTLAAAAIGAVETMGLTFGAVDCCVNTDNNPIIFEVNSAPGLEASSLTAYVDAFTKSFAAKAPKAPVATKGEKVAVADAKPKSAKEVYLDQIDRLRKMITDSDAEDAESIQRLGAELIFGRR